jgi:hypothetical protein
MRSIDDYLSFLKRTRFSRQENHHYLKSVTPASREPFTVSGYSYTAGKHVDFLVDYQHAGEKGPVVWRERVNCPDTYFNNRMRGTFHIFDIEMEPYPDISIYMTEAITPVYKRFSEQFPNTIGSEFYGDRYLLGELSDIGVRNEDVTRLTFADQQFERLISLDVFEHVPDYKRAFAEAFRVLKAQGKMMWTVPFSPLKRTNTVRATVRDGMICHLLPPEYHGDPLSDQGVLCFQYFGWEMLEQMKEAGFKDAYAICYESKEFGYLGGEQFMFFGVK